MDILVVDDSDANRKFVRSVIEDLSYQVTEAVDGLAALNAVKQQHPDIIIMDAIMPNMDGFEATHLIRNHLQTYQTHIPIVFLTALDDDDALSQCLQCGGDDFIAKPINVDVLVSKIKAHSRIRHLTTQMERQNAMLQRFNEQTQREHLIARTLFDRATATNLDDCEHIRSYVAPATTFNGDLLLSTRSPSGGLYCILCDFTGHGLPAAIGTLPVSKIFFELTESGESVGDIARHLNRVLKEFLLDDMFAAAAIIELNAEGKRACVWHGGTPDIILCDSAGTLKRCMQSQHMPLGVLEDHEFERDIHILKVDTGDRFYIYSDGITEQKNNKQDMFGEQRLLDLFEQHHDDIYMRILYELSLFCGTQQSDDITLLEITCLPFHADTPNHQTPEYPYKIPCNFEFNLEAEQLKTPAPINPIIDTIGEMLPLKHHKGYLHTILVELFANALEHGVLKISSTLKKSQQGYISYYQLRQKRINALVEGSVNISINYQHTDTCSWIDISVKDSGDGFDSSSISPGGDHEAFGRGISLIHHLCDQVTYSDGGSRVTVRYTIH